MIAPAETPVRIGHGFFPPPNGVSIAGDIHFDTAETWKIGFGGAGFDIFTVLAHEIGHAIGLDHTAVPGSLMNAFYSEAFTGLQADDIAGAVFIYGAASGGGPGGAAIIPLPAALPLFLTGLAGLGLMRRRKRQA